MAKINFSIKHRPQIESGEYKVETRDGRPARVICWDRKHEDYPLVVLFSDGKFEDCEIYTINGKFYCSQEEHRLDLIIITPEPKLSMFEEAIGCEIFDSPFNEEQIKLIKEESAKLLKLAREGYVPREEKWSEVEKTAKVEFLRGADFGREEVLKDLPKWTTNFYKEDKELHISWRKGTAFICVNDKIISFEDLKRLPGFKEDEK